MKTLEYALYWDGRLHMAYDNLPDALYWFDKYKLYYPHAAFGLKKREIKETDITPLTGINNLFDGK